MYVILRVGIFIQECMYLLYRYIREEFILKKKKKNVSLWIIILNLTLISFVSSLLSTYNR